MAIRTLAPEKWLYDETIQISLSQNGASLLEAILEGYKFEPWELSMQAHLLCVLKEKLRENRQLYSRENSNG
jgi:hypothetical protein